MFYNHQREGGPDRNRGCQHVQEVIYTRENKPVEKSKSTLAMEYPKFMKQISRR